MKAVLGANLKLVSGYPGNQEVRAAIEKGEAEAYCATWEAVSRGLEPWKQAGQPPYKILVQEGPERLADPELKDVPLMRELAKSEDDKLMFRLLSGVSNFTRPYAAPPGVPADRVEALRQAFMEAFKDPELKAEADKARLEFDPRPGAQVEAGFKQILATPKASVERFAKLMATQ
jgi:tripartite-type tricarboxylate transporter receptor subunit TctC